MSTVSSHRRMKMSRANGAEPSHGAARATHNPRPLHRLGTVRRLQGLSRRAVARRLNVEVSAIKCQERATADMPLSRLYDWQQVLEVPIAELLVDTDDPLSPPVLKRAQLLRLMKTVMAVLEETRQPSVRRMAQTLVEQLTEIMPELRHVPAWHRVGQRRRADELGQTAYRCLADEVFLDRAD